MIFKLNFYKSFKNNFGNVILPLLIGLGILSVVLGGLILTGKRSGEGKFQIPLFPEKEKESLPVLQDQNLVAGQKIFLNISTPSDGSEVSQASVVVSGQSLAGAEISVNEKDLYTDVQGNFSTTISLEEGENYILITAGNADGFEEKEIVVYYEK